MEDTKLDIGLDEEDFAEAKIRKEGNKWCVYNEKGTRRFGCYATKEAAQKRLRQMELFKNLKKHPSLKKKFKNLKSSETEVAMAGEILMIDASEEVPCNVNFSAASKKDINDVIKRNTIGKIDG